MTKEQTAAINRCAKAWTISGQIFGTPSLFAAQEIANYLSEDVDEDDLAGDIKAAYTAAIEICKTDKPSPEQVFWVFEQVFVGE